MKKVIIASLVLLVISSCTKNFEEINTDPDGSTETSTAFLLTSAQKTLMDFHWDEWWNGRRGNQLAQFWASNQYSNESRYALRVTITNNYFTNFYARSLEDLTEIIRLNTESPGDYSGFGTNANQIAVANLLKAWCLQNNTDVWGPIPFSQANRGFSDPTPPLYDSQADVYAGLLDMVNGAISRMDTDGAGPTGDQIFGGDMTKWKKFGNSLKVRIAMRMSDVNTAAASAAVSEALASGVMESNDDSAIFTYLGGAPNNNPLNQDRYADGRNDFACANTMIDIMNDLGDPRLEWYAERSVNTGDYVGKVYGESEANAALTSFDDVSQRSNEVLEATAPGIFLDNAEVQFFLAEAAERGFIGGSASDYYDAGVRASMDFWSGGSLSDTDVDAYLANPDVNYDDQMGGGASFKDVIGKQKWLALYMQGIEAWSEWRRLDFGILQMPADGVLDGSGIPLRFQYPTEEYDRNAAGITSGVNALNGGDNLDTRLWWDQN